jgi:hypothetical protein
MTHITIEKEKLKQVLNALGQLWLFSDEAAVIANPAISAVKGALAAPPLQEPVIAGSLSVRYFRGCKSMTNADFDYEGDLPEGDYTLYTTPPAQPAPVQEPVAKKTGIGLVTSNGWDSLPVGTLFYTTPPAAQRQWVGLTDEEADNFLKAVWGREVTPKHFIQAIESKLKEKNT